MKRHGWRRLVGIALAGAILLGCSRPAAAPPTGAAPTPTKLTVAYSQVTFTELVLWLAKEAGIFEKHGLDVDLQNISSSNAIAALLSGQVQVTHAGGSETMSANLGGADLAIVAMTDAVYPFWLMAQPSIRTPDDLRGKKIGISQPGSSSDIATRVVLKRLGIDPDQDVTLLPVGSVANRTAALLSGSIDAGLDNPPGALAQEAQGIHPLVDLVALKLPAATETVVVQRSFMDANPTAVQAYVDSIMEAQARIRSDRATSIAVLKKYFQSDDDEAMNATYEFALECMPDVPTPLPEQFADSVEQLAAKNDAARGYDVSRMLVTKFVQSALDRGLGHSGT